MTPGLVVDLLLLVPVVGGTVYGLLCMVATALFRRRLHSHRVSQADSWPPATILKPIYGLEKRLEMN